jgi:hypothetical protein
MAVCVLLLPLAVSATVNEDVLLAMQVCNETATTFEQQRYCMIKATPRKCRHLVRGKPQQGLSMSIRQRWLGCVSTCEGANLLSRTLGECSTPSDPSK